MTARRMFGGHGLYLDGVIFAIESGAELWLKTDAETRLLFAAAGGRPFRYQGKAGPVETSYWSPPEGALDSFEAARPWVERALAASRRKASRPGGAKPGRRARSRR